METTAYGIYFQESDHVRIKRTRQTGRINAIDGGVVYVLMDGTNESKLFAAYAQKPEELPGPSDERETEGQPPQLSAQQQSDLAAIENYARHFGLEQEGLAFAYKQAGLPPPTEEQKQAAERGLPLRPEQPAKKLPPSNRGGFYLGETSQ